MACASLMTWKVYNDTHRYSAETKHVSRFSSVFRRPPSMSQIPVTDASVLPRSSFFQSKRNSTETWDVCFPTYGSFLKPSQCFQLPCGCQSLPNIEIANMQWSDRCNSCLYGAFRATEHWCTLWLFEPNAGSWQAENKNMGDFWTSWAQLGLPSSQYNLSLFMFILICSSILIVLQQQFAAIGCYGCPQNIAAGMWSSMNVQLKYAFPRKV
jgi:hypothetical protein